MTQHRAVLTVSAVFQFQTEQVGSAQQAAWHCAAVVSGWPILSVVLEESPQHSVPFRLVGKVQAGGAGAAPAEEAEAAVAAATANESALSIIHSTAAAQCQCAQQQPRGGIEGGPNSLATSFIYEYMRPSRGNLDRNDGIFAKSHTSQEGWKEGESECH